MNVPQLRFKGFKGDWDKLLLKEVIENIVSGVSVNSIDKPASPNTLGVLKTSCISKGRFYPAENKEVLEAEINRVKVSPINSSILISRMNTPQLVGEIGYVNEDFPNLFLPDRLWMATTIPTVSSKWLTFLLTSNKYNSKILSLATGTSNSMKNISKEQFLSLEIKIPSKNEQDKISAFLTLLEQRIYKQEEKIEKLEQLKKGMMQKIFSQELRFKDEDGGEFPEWEEKLIGDFIVDYIEKTTVKNQYPVLTSSRKGLVFQKDHFKDRQVTTDENVGYHIIPRSYFTYRSRSDDGRFFFNRNTIVDLGIVSYFYPVFNVRNINPDYFWIFINNYLAKEILIETVGTSQLVLSLNKFKKLKIITPDLKEQDKIGSFFSEVEIKIEKEKEKLMVLEEQKKGFLQGIFI